MNIAKPGQTRWGRRLAEIRRNSDSAVRRPHEPAAPENRPPALRRDKPPASVTLELPLVTMQVRAPQIHLPHVSLEEAGLVIDAARSLLPPPGRVIYYGGLGALAAIDVIEWPVAAAIGVSTAVAQRAVCSTRQEPGSGGADRADGSDGAAAKPTPA